ncbi:stage II sporulation protein M, partial [Tamlana crocina]|nr:stage II sporulation protein M [Tamlana crocina]
FMIFVAAGSFSAASDGAFVRSILGDAYINMTLENIANDDPMAVYKKMGEMEMFLGITINNVRVALMAFVFGIFAGLGTLYIVMQNAIMLGSFQYFFYEQGLLW